MKGDTEVIDLLNKALRNELTAINQYFLHARMYKSWGISKLGEHEYQESIEEMRHADRLIERILFLGGLPNLQSLGKLYVGEDVKEMLECDLKLEQEGLSTLQQGIELCESKADYGSRQLLADILGEEEGHIDWLEAQFDLLKRMGIENYVQLQSGAAGS